MGQTVENWYDPEFATFGDRLAAARENTGLSQAALAKRVGIKASTVRKWEDDLAEPRANRLSMLAGVLGVSIGWLITGAGEGVEAPEDTTSSSDFSSILNELRDLRLNFSAQAEHVGRIEKRLRRLVEQAHVE